MPIFEYVCHTCHHAFETLMFASQQASCPQCSGTNLEKQFSLFAVNSKTTAPLSQACKKLCENPQEGLGSCNTRADDGKGFL